MQSCPKSKTEWTEASQLNCKNHDEYHCVRDALKAQLFCLCHPNIPIGGKHCIATVTS